VLDGGSSGLQLHLAVGDEVTARGDKGLDALGPQGGDDDSEYGLSGGVWSADEDHALAVARRVRTGTITVNGASVAFGGPFGGFKASGIGREYGAVGLGTYTEYKTITV